MLILPIKRKWFDMIRSGQKKEEYRDIKTYYSSRFKNLYSLSAISEKEFVKELRKMKYGLPFKEIVLRAGYSRLSPAIRIEGSLRVGRGKRKWGAEPGKEYYILSIEGTEDLLTDDWKPWKRGEPHAD